MQNHTRTLARIIAPAAGILLALSFAPANAAGHHGRHLGHHAPVVVLPAACGLGGCPPPPPCTYLGQTECTPVSVTCTYLGEVGCTPVAATDQTLGEPAPTPPCGVLGEPACPVLGG